MDAALAEQFTQSFFVGSSPGLRRPTRRCLRGPGRVWITSGAGKTDSSVVDHPFGWHIGVVPDLRRLRSQDEVVSGIAAGVALSLLVQQRDTGERCIPTGMGR